MDTQEPCGYDDSLIESATLIRTVRFVGRHREDPGDAGQLHPLAR